MLATFRVVLTYPFSFFRHQHDLALEVMALRHQLMVLKRQTRRPRLRRSDRYLWLLLMRVWLNWRNPLIILQPEPLIAWQRAGFRMLWRWKSRHRLGPPQSRSFQHHRFTIGFMDRTADCQCLPLRYRAQVSVAGPRFDLRIDFHQEGKGHGHPAEADGPEIALAKSLCRAVDRVHSARILDRVIVLNAQQLRRILEDYFDYYHKVRPHRSLIHDRPIPRPVESPDRGKVVEMPWVGGLHHQYLRQAA